MIEHISRWQGLVFIRERRPVLVGGGVLRIATPDLERTVHEYLHHSSPFAQEVRAAADAFCFDYRAYQDALGNAIWRLVRKLVGGDNHQWLYDHVRIDQLLCEGGFIEIVRRSYHEGLTPDLAPVEHRELGLLVEAW